AGEPLLVLAPLLEELFDRVVAAIGRLAHAVILSIARGRGCGVTLKTNGAPLQRNPARSVPLECHFPANDGQISAAPEWPAPERCIAALRVEKLRPHFPAGSRIEDDDVGRCAGGQGAARQVED